MGSCRIPTASTDPSPVCNDRTSIRPAACFPACGLPSTVRVCGTNKYEEQGTNCLPICSAQFLLRSYSFSAHRRAFPNGAGPRRVCSFRTCLVYTIFMISDIDHFLRHQPSQDGRTAAYASPYSV